jgi:predicted choloylglycine hydrolase
MNTDLRKRFILTAAILLFAGAIGKAEPNDVFCKESIVAGSPKDFVEVRHVIIKGTNFQIGKKIAEIVRKNNLVEVPSEFEKLRNKAQRAYMEQNYPVHYERMKGSAAAFGLDMQDDTYDFSALLVPMELPGVTGCSAVFYPAAFMKTGHDILSRNFDFSTRTLEVTDPRTGKKPAQVIPYVFEIYPDKGYPSLCICAYDYLGGVLDGINSQGLAVAVFAEHETMNASKPEAGIGMHEILCMRYLLDTCGDTEQAKQAMLSLKHYYISIPCHYLIADKSGKSFIFEISPTRDKTFVLDGDGPQCITNHLVSRRRKISTLPNNVKESYRRLDVLRRAVKADGKFSIEQAKEINSRVAISPNAPQDRWFPPARTLWHSIYDLDEGKMSVKFYLGEEPDPGNKYRVIQRYSPYVDFQLSSN